MSNFKKNSINQIAASLACIVCLVLILSLAPNPVSAEVPTGSYQQSCNNIRQKGPALQASCQRMNGRWLQTTLEDFRSCITDIANDDGTLICTKGDVPPQGSYQASCDDYWINGANLVGHCGTMAGNFIYSSIQNYKECSDQPWNSDGNLRCNKGGVPPSGSYQASCDDIWVEAGNLNARCKTGRGVNHNTVLNNFGQCSDQPWNSDGNLRCNKGGVTPSGSYQASCDDIWVEAGNLHARCETGQGGLSNTVLANFSGCNKDIANIDGTLRCWDNNIPSITSSPVTIAKVSQQYRYRVKATDADGDPLTFSLAESPTGMTINSSGLIEWTPVDTQVGTQHAAVKVDDGKFGIARQRFDINVSPSPAPQASSSVSIRSSATPGAPFCTAALRFNWAPISINPNGSGASNPFSIPQNDFTKYSVFVSGDNMCYFDIGFSPQTLRLGRWRISIDNSILGTVAICDVDLAEGPNWTAFNYGKQGCSNSANGFQYP